MVKICGNLYFRAEPTQYVLVECGQREKLEFGTKKPTGEWGDYETEIGYYTSLESLIKGCKSYALKKKIMEEDLQTINEVIDVMCELLAVEEKLLTSIKDF